MAGKRHHTIPRFMLKGFESSRRGEQVLVWMYRKGHPGIELVIENVGVEKHFYGKAGDSDLDSLITALEPDLASLVDRLRTIPLAGAPIMDREIVKLVPHLCFRTRQLRQSVQDTVNTMITELREQLCSKEFVQAAFNREMAKCGGLSGMVREQIIRSGARPEIADWAIQSMQSHLPSSVDIEQWLPEFHQVVDAQISTIQSILPEAMKAGFIDSMSRNINMEQWVARYAHYNWFVVGSSLPILLGDTVILFEATGARRFRPIEDGSDEIQRIYLPLTPTRVLIGSPCRVQPLCDFKLLNRAIARCSYEFVVSSTALGDDSSLVKDLGKWSGLLSDDELRAILDEAKRALMSDV